MSMDRWSERRGRTQARDQKHVAEEEEGALDVLVRLKATHLVDVIPQPEQQHRGARTHDGKRGD